MEILLMQSRNDLTDRTIRIRTVPALSESLSAPILIDLDGYGKYRIDRFGLDGEIHFI